MSAKRQEVINNTFTCIMEILQNSELRKTLFWPDNDFIAGWDNFGKNDVICVNVFASPPINLVQFNIYGSSIKRIRDQDMAIKKLFHQTIYNEIYFELEMELSYSSLAQPHFNGRIGMVTSRFNFST